VENHAAIDLVPDLLIALAAQLHDEAADLGAGVEGEVFLAVDGGPWVGHGEDRDGMEIAPAGLEPSTASAALEARRLSIVCDRRIGGHGLGLARGFVMGWTTMNARQEDALWRLGDFSRLATHYSRLSEV
jgi:hypothetical protein